MKNLKIFLYPFLFSLGFVFTYNFPLYIVVEMTDADGYGGLAIALIFIFAWLFLALPFYCIRYSKLIIDERFKYLFALYNAAVLVPLHIFEFAFEEEIVVGFALFVVLWSYLPLCLRLISRKNSDEISKKADTCSFLLQSKIKNIIAVCTLIPYIYILLDDFSALQIFELDYFMLYTLPCVSAMLVLAFVLAKNKKYLFKDRMLTFALAGELISGLYSVIFFGGIVYSYISIALIALMMTGTLFGYRHVKLLKYGSLGCALLRLGQLIFGFADREGFVYYPAELTDALAVNTEVVVQFLIVILYFAGIFLLATNKRPCK